MSTPHISEDALGHIWWHLTRRSWNGRRSFVTHTRTWRQIFLGCFRAPRCYQGPWLLLSCPASAAPYSSSQRKGSWTGRPRLSRLSLCLGEVTPRSPRWWGGCLHLIGQNRVMWSPETQRKLGKWEQALQQRGAESRGCRRDTQFCHFCHTQTVMGWLSPLPIHNGKVLSPSVMAPLWGNYMRS